MVQAKYSSSYRKKGTGTLMFVYIITGLAKEIQQYLDAMVKRTGKPEAELKDEHGNPLFWVNPEQRLANGQTTGKTINLSISRNGVVVEDTTDAVIARGNRITGLMEEKEAELLVQRKYGLVQLGARNVQATTTQKPAVLEAPAADELEEGIQQMQKETIKPALEGAGTETIGE